MSRTLTQKDAGVFIQFGPGQATHYLGDCIDLDSIPNPRLGGVEPIYCWNGRRDGFVEKGERLTPPGRVEYSVSELMEVTASWMEKINCPFTLFALRQTCGERGTFSAWERGHVVAKNRILDDPVSNVSHHVDDGDAMHEFSLSGSIPRMDVWPLATGERTAPITNGINAVATCGNLYCGDDCGAQVLPCDNLIAGTDARTVTSFDDGKANVLVSADNGVTWAVTETDPFDAADEHILAVACFEVSRNVNRYLVVRSTDAAAALEVGYSDDGGVTWTLVTVGSTVGETITGPNALFALNPEHIWLATDAGNVFFSADGGATWTDQGADTASAGEVLNAIHFADSDVGFAVGDNDTVLKTLNGGGTWASLASGTGLAVDLSALWVFSQYRILVGAVSAGGGASSLVMSFNGGTVWEDKLFTGSASEAVRSLYFVNGQRGVVATNTAGPVGSIHETIDGGNSWQERTINTVSTNTGFNDVIMCDMNTGVVVGEGGLILSLAGY